MTEPSTSSKSAVSRWWDGVSHHPLWAAVIATLIAAFVIARSGAVFTSSSSTASIRIQSSSPLLPAIAGNRALRVAFQPTEPPLYSVAFRRNIGKPPAAIQWRALHEKGGVDVGRSAFALTLTNRTKLPLTITNIFAEIIGAAPAPRMARWRLLARR